MDFVPLFLLEEICKLELLVYLFQENQHYLIPFWRIKHMNLQANTKVKQNMALFRCRMKD